MLANLCLLTSHTTPWHNDSPVAPHHCHDERLFLALAIVAYQHQAGHSGRAGVALGHRCFASLVEEQRMWHVHVQSLDGQALTWRVDILHLSWW